MKVNVRMYLQSVAAPVVYLVACCEESLKRENVKDGLIRADRNFEADDPVTVYRICRAKLVGKQQETITFVMFCSRDLMFDVDFLLVHAQCHCTLAQFGVHSFPEQMRKFAVIGLQSALTFPQK
eukprot:5694557-Amphidinium_carterae.2